MDHLSPDLSPITLDFPPPKHPSLGGNKDTRMTASSSECHSASKHPSLVASLGGNKDTRMTASLHFYRHTLSNSMVSGCPPGWTLPASGPTAGVCNWQASSNNPPQPPPYTCAPHAPFVLPHPLNISLADVQPILDAVAWAKTCNVDTWPELATGGGIGNNWCVAMTQDMEALCTEGLGPNRCVVGDNTDAGFAC